MSDPQVAPAQTPPAADGPVRFMIELGSAVLEVQARCHPHASPPAAEWRALQEAHEQALREIENRGRVADELTAECQRLQAALATATAGREAPVDQSAADRDALVARLEEAEARAARAEAACSDLAGKLRDAQASFKELARDRALDQLAHEKALRELENRRPSAAVPASEAADAPEQDYGQAPVLQMPVRVPVPVAEPVPMAPAGAALTRPTNGRTEWAHEGLALQEKLESSERRWRERGVPIKDFA